MIHSLLYHLLKVVLTDNGIIPIYTSVVPNLFSNEIKPGILLKQDN